MTYEEFIKKLCIISEWTSEMNRIAENMKKVTENQFEQFSYYMPECTSPMTYAHENPDSVLEHLNRLYYLTQVGTDEFNETYQKFVEIVDFLKRYGKE